MQSENMTYNLPQSPQDFSQNIAVEGSLQTLISAAGSAQSSGLPSMHEEG